MTARQVTVASTASTWLTAQILRKPSTSMMANAAATITAARPAAGIRSSADPPTSRKTITVANATTPTSWVLLPIVAGTNDRLALEDIANPPPIDPATLTAPSATSSRFASTA